LFSKRKIAPAINEARRFLEQAGFSGENISSEILTWQRSRAAAVVKAASDGGYKTIVLGRRVFTTVGEFKLGRVSRKILQYAFQPALWIVN
jgi:nucleotide-binding universal stress UspA family protein